MTPRDAKPADAAADWAVGERALRMAVLALPHLAGLARTVRMSPDRRHETAGVFASGRVLFNPDFLRKLGPTDAAFVMAHELLHLALHTHRRGEGADQYAVNVAHDYVINDMLVSAFGRPVPGGGLYHPGSASMSLERLLGKIRDGTLVPPRAAWGSAGAGGVRGRRRPLRGGLRRRVPPQPPEEPGPPSSGDVLGDDLERTWYPGTTPTEQARQREQVERQGAKAVSLSVFRDALTAKGGAGQAEPGTSDLLTGALRGYYHTPWEAALQKWMEFVAPGDRTYARPSRRGADRTDVVLPGRTRVGWTLNIVLDTSGSMTNELPRALGAIASFCESAGVWQARLLQCDTGVTADEFIEPERLAEYEIKGLGGSDMSPALRFLAEDPEVEAVVVLTDGYIDYPAEEMPYHVLWGVLVSGDQEVTWFTPTYGDVVPVPVEAL
jgi:predicted metal-dependent peptidase